MPVFAETPSSPEETLPWITKWTGFGARHWYGAAVLAILGVVGCLLFSSLHLLVVSEAGSFWGSMLNALLLALAFVAPLLFFIGLKSGEIVLLREAIAQIRTQDHLTSCLNGITFSALVDTYLDLSKLEGKDCRGALVIIDADHFGHLNERFGHGSGDQALRVVAGIIRTSVRSGDLVCRIGGSEFGVFLPGARREEAEEVGERIRHAIMEAQFAPGGSSWPLSVSGGAALFAGQIDFQELFDEANRQLRSAKASGRNRIEYAQIRPVSP